MPKYLQDHKKSTNSINFQVIAGRGKGKSTMVREILLLNNLAELSKTEAKYERLPETGSSETTKCPTPYKFKSVKTVSLYFFEIFRIEKYVAVYVWDMPGLGGKKFLKLRLQDNDPKTISGLQISTDKNWDSYLEKYGTGHFDRTFLICNANEGINEMELYFLRHLIHNKRFILTR